MATRQLSRIASTIVVKHELFVSEWMQCLDETKTKVVAEMKSTSQSINGKIFGQSGTNTASDTKCLRLVGFNSESDVEKVLSVSSARAVPV